MSSRTGFYLGVLVAIALGLFVVRLWRPEIQVRTHSAHLLDAIDHKDWTGFDRFIADDYQDQWGNDRSLVIERTREVFRRLRDVRIDAIGVFVQIEGERGIWRANIQINGDDRDELMTELKMRVNPIKAPFELEWRHQSRKPWDWKLVAVRNSELTIPQY
jgi:hypothetical protein